MGYLDAKMSAAFKATALAIELSLQPLNSCMCLHTFKCNKPTRVKLLLHKINIKIYPKKSNSGKQ